MYLSLFVLACLCICALHHCALTCVCACIHASVHIGIYAFHCVARALPLQHARTRRYLEQILTAKVYDVCHETALQEMSRLSERVGSSILVKREDTQPVFSFKLRGAYNMIANLPQAQLDKGIITASAGNHAQGVAFSAKHLGCKAVIAMPTVTPAIKVNSVKRLGAEVVLVGDNFDETKKYALERSESDALVFIPPFDHPLVIAGQGTIGMEILRQCTRPIDAIFVPVGGGGLIAGIAAYVKRLRPDILVIGVEPKGANAMYQSLKDGGQVCARVLRLGSRV